MSQTCMAAGETQSLVFIDYMITDRSSRMDSEVNRHILSVQKCFKCFTIDRTAFHGQINKNTKHNTKAFCIMFSACLLCDDSKQNVLEHNVLEHNLLYIQQIWMKRQQTTQFIGEQKERNKYIKPVTHLHHPTAAFSFCEAFPDLYCSLFQFCYFASPSHNTTSTALVCFGLHELILFSFIFWSFHHLANLGSRTFCLYLFGNSNQTFCFVPLMSGLLSVLWPLYLSLSQSLTSGL